MTGSTNLQYLLKHADPVLDPASYVFVSVAGSYGDYSQWQPIASFVEREGLTLIVRQDTAQAQGLSYDGVYVRITLRVHSSLSAVGLTAAVSGCLAGAGVSANFVAAFHHDHIFVPASAAQRALAAIAELSAQQ